MMICLLTPIDDSSAQSQFNATDPALDQIAQKNTITLMTYNIQQLGYPNWAAKHFEKERLALIPATILGLEKIPDILVLQEVFTTHSFEFLILAMAKTYPYHTEVVAQDCQSKNWTSVGGNCQQHTWKGNGGVLIFSRWPMTEKHAYVYHAGRVSRTFDFLAQKGVVYASIAVDQNGVKQQIHVLGTHLQADGESHDIRMQQVSEMRDWFDAFNVPKSEAVVLAGDFNVSSNDEKKFAELLRRTNTTLVFAEQKFGSVSPRTNRYGSLIGSGTTEKTLDFILYRSDHLAPLKTPALEVINLKSDKPWLGERLFDEVVELRDLSDHYPTLMVLEF